MSRARLFALVLASTLAIPRQAAAQDVVPFRLVRDQVVVPVVIAGDTTWMLLDTGVTPSVIDVAIARAQGWLASDTAVGRAGGAGSGQGQQLYQARVGRAQLGTTDLDGTPAVATNIAPLGERLGLPLGGILGHGFLRTRRIRVDYQRREIVIEPAPDPALQVLFADSLRYVRGDIMPRVVVQVDGTPVPVSLDTGSSLTLELWPAAAERAGVTADSGAAVGLMGARGGFEAKPAHVGVLQLGEVRRVDVEVHIAPEARGSADREGNLGNGFLAGLVLTLDYRAGRIEIARRMP
jgi:predicted aspartyl protease